MKKTWVRMFCFLLAAGMLLSGLPDCLPRAAAAGNCWVKLPIQAADNCRVYYNERITGEPWSSELREAAVGPGIAHTGLEWPYGILLFVAPDDGYALSAFRADNTAGNYYSIADGEPDGTGCSFLSDPKNYQSLLAVGYSEEEVKGLVAEAIRQNCHCALLLSRVPNSVKNISSTLRFYAERLPTLEKRLLSVTPQGADTPIDAQPDLCAGVGDVLNYELSVTFYPPENREYPLIYSDVYVTDEKTGSTGENRLSISPPSQKQQEGMTDRVVISHQVQYTVTALDLALGTVDNRAQLSFRFRPQQRKTANDAVIDARVSSTVRASVGYRYESAVAAPALPAELAELTPTDYARHAEGDAVSSQPHARSMYWDAANDGYWTLLDGGVWTDDGGLRVAAGETFTMPDAPVMLTATWTFTKAPDIELEKDGRIISVPGSGEEGDQVDYIAAYTLSVQNTGGEPLSRFTVRDDTLPEDASDIQLFAGGNAVPRYDSAWSGNALTIRLDDPLEPDDTLTISYSCRRTGTLGYKTQLMDISLADITAAGAQTGVEVWKECDLNLQTTLQKAILLTPADMVIYAGEPTDGAGVVKGTNLPETGFFVTLPLEAETALRTALNTQEPSDLTPYLTFTDDGQNEWRLAWFREDHAKANGRFLYLLRPKDDPLDQTRFELQFYDPVKGTNVRQSDFQITDALQQEYKMTIFPGDRPASHPRGVLRVGDKELGSYALDITPGTLFVRGTTKHLQVNDIELGSADFTGGMVVNCLEQDGVTYCINETMLSADRDNVKLLVDHIVGSVYGVTLQKMAGDVIENIQADVQNPLQYQYRYLDLVDTSMGNAWVTVNKPVEIVWRYPDGADREDDFTIIHYKDLDRNYNLSDLERLELGKDYKLEVFTTRELGENTERITYHRLERGEKGLTFSTKSFSPYVLIWEGKPASQPDQGSGPVRTDRPSRERRAEAPEPPAAVPPELLSTDEHHAYLVGRGEGGVQPLAHITRGEVAAIWFRLLTDEARAAHWSTDDRYPDVGPAFWCRNAIATMTNAGVLRGDEQGNYRPGDAITRAEFTAAAVRFFQAPQAETGIPFSDVPASAWYAEAVRDGAALGLITGGGDGAFRPDDPITRAEVAAIVNRMLGRKPHSGPLPEHTAQWADNPMDAWYYGDMLEATVSHTCEWLEGESTEHWTGPLETRDWNALERFGPDGAARA